MSDRHIHKYIRKKLGRTYVIYKCVLPNCAHYLSKDLILGRNSICWRCGNVFTITKHHKKPHCVNCTRTKKHTDVLVEAMRELGIPI